MDKPPICIYLDSSDYSRFADIGYRDNKAEEAILAPGRDFGRRGVGAEERVDVEFVVRDQPRHPARHPGMAGQRAVLGLRQLEPGLDLGRHHSGHGNGAGGKRENRQ